MAKRTKQKVSFGDWVAGARLRTLPLAVAPVAVGFGVASAMQAQSVLLTLLALAVAVFLQIGVNYANDYSDGIRGTDDFRVGPMRLTGSGRVEPKRVRNLAFAFFGLAAVAGLVIVVVTLLWWLIAVGAACIVAAWFYTGGKKPYGYAGLGELFVFVFFGLVATFGTVAIQVKNFFTNADGLVWTSLGAVSMGLFASAVLMVNNIRDIDTDKAAGKKTLAVRVGRKWAKAIYLVFLWVPMVLLFPYILVFQLAGFAYFVLVLVLPLTLIVVTAETSREYILALKLTSYAALAYGLLLAYGMYKIV
jgi:1,4-dihydroxy-2-naphthoate octaprenyltransferase